MQQTHCSICDIDLVSKNQLEKHKKTWEHRERLQILEEKEREMNEY